MRVRGTFRSVAVAAIVAAFGAARPAHGCVGDCDGDDRVTVDELVAGVNVALGSASLPTCLLLDDNEDGRVTVDELVSGVNNALSGCRPGSRELCTTRSPLRNVYYGDLHVHTTYSFDAHIYDVRTTPDQAYRFAQGDPVALPPLDAQGQGTQTVQLDRPLDFAAVTDHSEFLGEVETCITPGSPGYDSPSCVTYRAGGDNATRQIGGLLTSANPTRIPEICGVDGQNCRSAATEVWQRIQQAAETAYDRSARCAFSSFVAYEYSAGTGVSTLHRNVIFRNASVPFPTTYFEQPTPKGLWTELQATCRGAGIGCDVIAIPHNSNESNGHMFHVEYPGATTLDDQRSQAAFRASMEPLVEIFQHKGDSECMNGLSGIVGQPDELCDFEKRRTPPFPDCGDGVGNFGTITTGCVSRFDFVRNVLVAGLQENERLGVNPFRLGITASTDTHNGVPGNVAEDKFIGHRGSDDDTPAKQLGHGSLYAGGIIFNPGGITGVWAEANTRSSLFEGFRRREVFGTSGPRIAVRFFGGWNFAPALCSDPQLVERGYADGVPMGGALAPRPSGAAAPTFVISALRDPGATGRPGGLLQRLQVIKGWIENGERHEQVFDVAGDPNNGATVDTTTCTPQGAGADSLCTVWSDPAFNPAQQAFYYARVIENPSCRWSTYVCNRLPIDQQPASCSDPAVAKTIQERAWTSPIWYEGQ
ncbi:MAG TPA: DUF3604 domain-containing protein [Candidatus Binatia bacterium]|nr:DUF3604 domain-containing protein [Candidatus Binatia bacterium]